jgi:hypothetical protein
VDRVQRGFRGRNEHDERFSRSPRCEDAL